MKRTIFLPYSLLIFILFFSFNTIAQVGNYNFKVIQGNYNPVATQAAFHQNNSSIGINFAEDTLHYGSSSGTKFRGLPIGFDFVFDGDTQSVFGISSLGYMVLGKDSVLMYSPWSNGFAISGNGVSKIISPMGGSYVNGAIIIKYETVGISPNRVLIVQWENMTSNFDYNNPSDRDSLDFQVKLFETENKIQFVYGSMQWCSLPSNARYEVGIKGNTNSDFNSRLLFSDWEKTIPACYPTANCRLNKKIFPAIGTIYEFTPAPSSCDSALFTGIAFAKSYALCASEKVEITIDSMKMSSSIIWQWQHSIDSVNWTDILNANLKNFSGTQSGTTFYRCKITCGLISHFSNTIKIFQLQSTQCYCKNAGSKYPSSINIGSVSFSSINTGSIVPQVNNNSNFKAFSDYTLLPPAQIEQGGNIPIFIKPIYKDVYEKTAAYAFIDFNKDGDFNDSNETFYLGKSKTGTGGYEVNHFVQIPAVADTGITVLRITLYGVNNTLPPFAACSNTYDGETEDYLLRIIPAAPCITLPISLAAITLTPTLCLNDTFSVTLSQSITTSFSYQWYASTDTVNWLVVPNATANNFSSVFSQTAFYRCKVKCANDSMYTSFVQLIEKPKVNCFCKSQSSWQTASKITRVEINNFSNISTFGGVLYSNYTNLDTIRLVKGGSYHFALELQSPTYEYGYTRVFADFNQNGNFELSEKIYLGQAISSINLLKYAASIMIPVNVPSGLCLLRLFVDSQNNGPPFCNNGDMDEVEDYILEIKDADTCHFPVNAGFAQAADSALCDSAIAIITLGGLNYSPNYSYQWQYSNDSMNWVFNVSDSLFTMSHKQDSSTFYRCRVACSGDTAFSLPTKIAQQTGYSCCGCQTHYGLHDDIGNVTLAGISYGQIDSLDLKVNLSNSNLGNAYTDFTDSLAPFVLEQNGNYPIAVTHIYSSKTYPTNIEATVYIDFNQNQIYDTNEVFKSSKIDGFQIFTGTAFIHVPANAILGTTRMRVILNYSSAGFTFPPCNPNLYAFETEDYLISIINSQSCMQSIAGTLLAPQKSVCKYNLSQLFLAGNSNFGGQTYQWQRSVDDSIWSTISNANSTNYMEGCTASSYFRCIVNCGIFADTTASIFIQLKPFYQCNCINPDTIQTNFFDEFDIGNVSIGSINNGVSIPRINNATATHMYSDYTSIVSTPLSKGMSYPLTVKQISLGKFYKCHVIAIIDFNHDKIYSNDEFFDLGITSDSSLTGSTRTKNIIIPYYAHSGPTLLRICLIENVFYDNTPLFSCTRFYNELEDYSITIANDNFCPQLSAGATLLTIGKACRYENFYAFLSGNTPLDGPVYTWQISNDSLTWSSHGQSNKPYLWTTNYDLNPKYYRCMISCDSLRYFSTPVKLNIEDTAFCVTKYPFFWSCSGILGGSDCDTLNRISNVSIDWTSLNNSDSVCYDIGFDKHYYYHAYGNFTANLQRGKTYTINVNTTKNDVISVWIDYNHNSRFDTTEWIHVCDTSVAGVPNSKVFTVPTSALLGKASMRVRSRYHDNPNKATDGCLRFYSGETEDYIISIDTITDISEISKADFTIYPNPANNFVQVNSTQITQEINVMDMFGKSLLQSKSNKPNSTIDVSMLIDGIYIVQCKFKNGEQIFKKFAMQH